MRQPLFLNAGSTATTPCPGHHKSLLIYEAPSQSCATPCQPLVSVLCTPWAPFFSAYRAFFRRSIGQKAENFPLDLPSQRVKEGEDRKLLFLPVFHKPPLLSPKREAGKGKESAAVRLLAYFLFIHLFNRHTYIGGDSACKSPLETPQEAEFWFSLRLILTPVRG